jgi:transketolase
MRNEFAKVLTELADQDSRIVLLMGDIGNKLFDDFRSKFPDRFYNCGVAEANMVSVAAGLALNGFRPFVYSITPFVTTRCLEQIRVGVCYHDVPVTIVGTGSGLSYAELGPTHHSCEDMSFLRSLPGMTVFAPADSLELRSCAKLILSQDRPAYMRIGKKGELYLHSKEPLVRPGEPIFIRRNPSKVCLLSCGTIGSVAKQVVDELEKKDIVCTWASLPNMKPLNIASIEKICKDYALVVTLEEHSLIGGLGSAIAEICMDRNIKGLRLLRLGTQDQFLHETGSQDYARDRYGLSVEKIVPEILKRLSIGEL